MNCVACEVISEKDICDSCVGWEMNVGVVCFLCHDYIEHDKKRYLKRGNLCGECQKRINREYWYGRVDKYRL